MADIELVIKLDEKSIKQLDKIRFLIGGREDRSLQINVINAIKNGIPLPKGHGDLKDMGNLQYVFDLTREDPIYSGKDIERAIKSMKSTIEADKTESEGI